MRINQNVIGNKLERSQIEALRVSSNRPKVSHSEKTVENAKNSPLGKLLENIATIPAIREEKVQQLRASIKDGSYNFDKHLDEAVDKVLEEMIL